MVYTLFILLTWAFTPS